jgi:hypothetical protein
MEIFQYKGSQHLVGVPQLVPGVGLTARNHAFLLTSPMINSISAPCSFNTENQVISTIPTIYEEKIREEVTLKPPVGDGSLFIGRLV